MPNHLRNQISKSNHLPVESIQQRIYLIRGHKVMLDSDLVELYGVETRVLNQQVRRNIDRFPADFMFRLTPEESEALRSQIVISKSGRGGRRYTIQAFAEQGVAMLSSILRSKQAVQVNILIMRAFVRLREILATHKGLARKLEELEKKVTRHDKEIKAVFEAIRSLLEPGEPPKSRQIGFQAGQGRAGQSRGAEFIVAASGTVLASVGTVVRGGAQHFIGCKPC